MTKTKESKREQIKDAVRLVLGRYGIDKDQAYELGCQIADELEDYSHD